MCEKSSVESVLLVRHASREVRWDLPDKYHAMKCWSESAFLALKNPDPAQVINQDCPPDVESSFSAISDYKTSGFNRTVALAGRLAEQLLDHEECGQVKIYHGCHLATVQTAQIYQQVLAKHKLDGGMTAVPWLDPGAEECLARIDTCLDNEKEAKCVMFVGHQPELTNITHHLLQKNEALQKNKLPADTLPLGGSEVACIAVNKNQRLRWLLTAKSPEQRAKLEAKIQSKYDVAKFFLGALIVNSGLILSADLWEPRGLTNRFMAYLAVLFSGAALIYTAATLFSYDELLMPSEYWGSPPGGKKFPKWNVERPPCQDQIMIFYEMVHIWDHFFRRAIITTFVSIAFFVMSLAYVTPPPLLPNARVVVDWLPTEGFLLVVAAILALWVLFKDFNRNRPRLGIND